MREIKWQDDLKSFLKTYVTVFLGLFLLGFDQGLDVFGVPFLLDAAKISLIAVARTIYKLLDEA